MHAYFELANIKQFRNKRCDDTESWLSIWLEKIITGFKLETAVNRKYKC